MGNRIYLIIFTCVTIFVQDSHLQNCDFSKECDWKADEGFVVTNYAELRRKESSNATEQLKRSSLGENDGMFIYTLVVVTFETDMDCRSFVYSLCLYPAVTIKVQFITFKKTKSR